MAKCYSNFMKVCATCAYWTGNRQTDYFGTIIMVVENNSFCLFENNCVCLGTG